MDPSSIKNIFLCMLFLIPYDIYSVQREQKPILILLGVTEYISILRLCVYLLYILKLHVFIIVEILMFIYRVIDKVGNINITASL